MPITSPGKFGLERLRRALEDLDRLFAATPDLQDTYLAEAVRIGQIKKFDRALDLTCEAMQDYLNRYHGFKSDDPSEVFKKFTELELIDERRRSALQNMMKDKDKIVSLCMADHYSNIRTTLMKYAEVLNEICDILDEASRDDNKWFNHY